MLEYSEVIVYIAFIYTTSSYIGFILFGAMWWAARRDRKIIAVEGTPEECRVIRRNEVVSGLLTTVFALYCIAGTLGSTRVLGVDWPWPPGLVTTVALVIGNIIEMAIAFFLIAARRGIQSDKGVR